MKKYLIIAAAILLFNHFGLSDYYWINPFREPDIFNAYKIKDHGKRISYIEEYIQQLGSDSVRLDFPYNELGDIYGDPDSDFYNPQEALRAYLKRYRNVFSSSSDTEWCVHYFSTIPESLVGNETHITTLDHLIKFCQLSNDDLLALAKDFETEGKQFFIDPFIALMLYEKLKDRLFSVAYSSKQKTSEKVIAKTEYEQIEKKIEILKIKH